MRARDTFRWLLYLRQDILMYMEMLLTKSLFQERPEHWEKVTPVVLPF